MADPAPFSDLRALFLNTSLTSSSQGESHTETLMEDSMTMMRLQGVDVRYLRAADHRIALGIMPDMREHGAEVDDWPDVFWPEVRDADILVIGTPLWLGEESSLCRIVIERLYAHGGQLNDDGQYVFYGKTGGCMVTGNEDGVKHASMTVLYALQHVGYVVPPQADAGWIGEIGPGASFGDDGAGMANDFTIQRTAFLTWNLLHTAAWLKGNGGFPAHGNQQSAWDDGERFGHPRA